MTISNQLYLVIDRFMASSVGSVASPVPISGDEVDSSCWPTSQTPQQVQKGMHFPGRREDQGVNQIESSQRGAFCKAESPPIIKSPTPVLRERSKPNQPSPPVKLRQIVKKKSHMLYKKVCTHYRHIPKATQLCYTKGSSTSDVHACTTSGLGDP